MSATVISFPRATLDPLPEGMLSSEATAKPKRKRKRTARRAVKRPAPSVLDRILLVVGGMLAGSLATVLHYTLFGTHLLLF